MEKRASPVSRREGGATGFYEEKRRLMGLFFIGETSSRDTSTSSLNPSLNLLLCVELGIISSDSGKEWLFTCLSLFSARFVCFLFLSDVQFFPRPFSILSYFNIARLKFAAKQRVPAQYWQESSL